MFSAVPAKSNELLKQRRFLPLFITQFCGAFNDNFYKSALAILVGYGVINVAPFSKAIIINLIAALLIAPLFIFSALAGQLSDKFEKSRVLKIVKAWEVIVGIIVILGLVYKSLFVLLLALIILACQYTFFGPAKYSILPENLAKSELMAANGLLDASTFISILIGTIVGGVIAEYFSHTVLIGVLFFLIAFFGFVSCLFIPKSRVIASEIKINRHIFQEIVACINYARNRPGVFRAIIGISWLWTVGFCFITQFPVMVSSILYAKPGVVTLFLAMFTIGVAVGALLCNKLTRGEVKTIFVPIAIFSMSIFMFDFVYTLHRVASLPHVGDLISIWQFFAHFSSWRMTFDLFFLAVSGGIFMVPLYVTLQVFSESDHVSRVVAANNIVNGLIMVVGIGLVSLLLFLGMSLIKIMTLLAVCNILVAFLLTGVFSKFKSQP